MKKIVCLLFIGVLVMGQVWAEPEKAAQKMLASSSSVSAVGGGTNVELLLNTMNETLDENRKIRTSMKEFQQALQQKTLENEDLKSKLSKLENLALGRNKELTEKTAELELKLKRSEEAAKNFNQEKQVNDQEKEKIRRETAEVRAENEKLRATLANAILDQERDEILKTARESGEAAVRTQQKLSELNSENQKFKNNLASAYYEMGNTLFKMKSYSEAVSAYQKVLEIDPTNAPAFYNLAVVEDYYMGDSKSAYQHYQMYLNYKPLNEEAQAVRRRILDLNLLQKVTPETPLDGDFKQFHQEPQNAKI